MLAFASIFAILLNCSIWYGWYPEYVVWEIILDIATVFNPWFWTFTILGQIVSNTNKT